MSKQTAVEWLIEKLPTINKYDPYYEEIIQKAKAMEKEKIEGAYSDGWMDCEKWFADKELDDYIRDANQMQEEINKQL